MAGGPGSLIKYNPLTNMSSAEVWNFLRVMVRQCVCVCVCLAIVARVPQLFGGAEVGVGSRCEIFRAHERQGDGCVRHGGLSIRVE